MSFTPKKLNKFLIFKLPSAWICGVRVKVINQETCITTVKHKWINQNPFKSMFWAVQGMAAELSTGVLVMQEIQKRGVAISMLVISNKATFVKKATGQVTFTCKDGASVVNAIDHALATGEGQTFWLQSKGINEENQLVSTFDFEWTVKLKENRE